MKDRLMFSVAVVGMLCLGACSFAFANSNESQSLNKLTEEDRLVGEISIKNLPSHGRYVGLLTISDGKITETVTGGGMMGGMGGGTMVGNISFPASVHIPLFAPGKGHKSFRLPFIYKNDSVVAFSCKESVINGEKRTLVTPIRNLAGFAGVASIDRKDHVTVHIVSFGFPVSSKKTTCSTAKPNSHIVFTEQQIISGIKKDNPLSFGDFTINLVDKSEQVSLEPGGRFVHWIQVDGIDSDALALDGDNSETVDWKKLLSDVRS